MDNFKVPQYKILSSYNPAMTRVLRGRSFIGVILYILLYIIPIYTQILKLQAVRKILQNTEELRLRLTRDARTEGTRPAKPELSPAGDLRKCNFSL